MHPGGWRSRRQTALLCLYFRNKANEDLTILRHGRSFMARFVAFRNRLVRLAQAEVGIGVVVLTTLGVLFALVAAVTMGFRQSTVLINGLDRSAEQRLVANYIDRQGMASVAQQKVQLTWDDAMRATVGKPDTRWLDSYLGDFLWSNFSYDRLYLVDAKGNLVRAWKNGQPDPRDAYGLVASDVRHHLAGMSANRTVFGRMAGVKRLQDTLWPIDERGRNLTRWARSIVQFEGRPAQMTVASIVPDTDMSLLRRTPNHMVALRFIDERYLSEMRSALLLSDVRVVQTDERSKQVNSLPLIAAHGQPVGWISWHSTPRGMTMAARMRPLFITFVCFLLALVFGFWMILRTLRRSLANIRQNEVRALFDARHDPMTGLPNRVYMAEQLERLLKVMRKQPGQAVAVAYFDLDNFKNINDTLGHSIGDALVQQVAQRCVRRLRRDDILARVGGDEFVAIRFGEALPGQINQLGRELMSIFAAPFNVEGRILDVTASCGISWAPDQGQQAEDLLKNADIALFRAKQRGRARWRAFTAEMADSVGKRLDLEIELRRAIQSDELTLAYQPIVEAATGRITGVEALLRWDHPERGAISPAHFVPIAEQAGLMNLLGWWTLGKVFEQRRAWPDLNISINLSPMQLSARGFLDDLEVLLREYRVPSSCLTFEVTEGVLMERGTGVFDVLAGLQELGIGIALDDFGTGYSSLGYLRSFQFDRIKIDRTFVQDIETDIHAQEILKTIVTLGHSLGIRTVAEGVESLVQRELVRSAGCDMIQGYFYWKPMGAPQLAELLPRQAASISAKIDNPPARRKRARA